MQSGALSGSVLFAHLLCLFSLEFSDYNWTPCSASVYTLGEWIVYLVRVRSVHMHAPVHNPAASAVVP